MGTEYRAKCKKCNTEFTVHEGGGFSYYMLHCDTCGKEKSISFKEIGEPHLQYLKGLPGPYSVSTSEHDRKIQENYPGEAIGEDEYYLIVEKLAGNCSCGGNFKFNAKPRCPKCRSTKIYNNTPDDEIILYD